MLGNIASHLIYVFVTLIKVSGAMKISSFFGSFWSTLKLLKIGEKERMNEILSIFS